MLKFKIIGGSTVNIHETNDFIASGGEKTIYSHGKEVLAIYHDANQMISQAKFQELSTLEKSNIIKPENLIENSNHKIVGYTMKNIKSNSVPLCRIFNTCFWNSNNINEKIITKLVEHFQETIDYIHSKECLIVDVSDLNFNIENINWNLIYFIDVNCYQTKSFPATAITPFIRDYSTNKWSNLTDWYSFAILTFQMFTGVHPFKGTHPKYTSKDTILRMQKSVSVFDKNVTLNSSIRDFSIIPSNYMNWYQDIFVRGKRLLPPGSAGLVNFVHIAKTIGNSSNFIIDIYKEYLNTVIDYQYVLGQEVVTYNNSILVNSKEFKKCKVFFDSNLLPYSIEKENGFLILQCLVKNYEIKSEIKFDDYFIYENNIYIKYGGELCHIIIFENGKRLLTIKNSWNIMPNSSEIFEGCVYQNILGTCYFSVPVPEKNWCLNLNIKELNGCKIIDVKRKKNFIFVVFLQNKLQKRCIIKFDESSNYKIVKEDELEIINFVVLDNGLMINCEEGKIEIYYTKYENDKKTMIEDDIIKESMKLVNKGVNVMFIENKKIKILKVNKK
jgi:hypothetical protein